MTGRPTRRAPAPAGPREPDRLTPEPDPAPAPAPPPPQARRAGGHVDRGDGRGWVLDDEEVE